MKLEHRKREAHAVEAQDALVPCAVRWAALEPGICARPARPRIPARGEGLFDCGEGPLLPLEVLGEGAPVNEWGLDEDDGDVGWDVGEQFGRVHAEGCVSIAIAASAEASAYAAVAPEECPIITSRWPCT